MHVVPETSLTSGYDVELHEYHGQYWTEGEATRCFRRLFVPKFSRQAERTRDESTCTALPAIVRGVSKRPEASLLRVL